MRQHRHSRWHLDGLVEKINGVQRSIWRAVDDPGEGFELDSQHQQVKGSVTARELSAANGL